MKAAIFYNPKCGTCRKVREILEKKGYQLQVIEYLRQPPSVGELDEVCKKLGMDPQELAREKEAIFAEVQAECHTRGEWLAALHDHPELIQRPIVVIGSKAIIARPPEALYPFINA